MVIFEIMGVRKSDEGKYCCTAKNKLGTDTATFQLQQLKPANKLAPKFTTQIKVGLKAADVWMLSEPVAGYSWAEGWNVRTL